MVRLLAALAGALLASVGLGAGAVPAAAAPEQSVSTECNYIEVGIGGREAPAVVTVEIDGRVVDSGSLRLDRDQAQYIWSSALDFDVAHEWSVTVESEDDAEDWSDSGTTTPCDRDPSAWVGASGSCGTVSATVQSFPAGVLRIEVDGEVLFEERLQRGVGGELPDPDRYGYESAEVEIDPTVRHEWTVMIDAVDDEYDHEESGEIAPCTQDPDSPTDVAVEARCDALTVDVTSPESGNIWIEVDGDQVNSGDSRFDRSRSVTQRLDPGQSHEWEVAVMPESEHRASFWNGTTAPCDDPAPGGDGTGGSGTGDDRTGPALPGTGPGTSWLWPAALLIAGGAGALWWRERRVRG
ncbi:hypothetical protein [Georgenia alba]|uniref:LPXTG cell wall anchor domain-containing protein n=1 Tax=Georgenia alba TaxID=2233858 RepID=A0ABW2QBB8_9MICO